VNHDGPSGFVAERVGATMGAGTVTDDAVSMASDDVSLFLQRRPGCFFFIGAAPDSGPPRPHHAPEFEMNERALPIGLRAGLEVVSAALAK
jgi:amidohydrolase